MIYLGIFLDICIRVTHGMAIYIFLVQMGVVSIILAVIFLSSSMPGTCLCKIQNIRGISSKTRMKFIEGKKLNKRFLEMVQVTVPIFLFW